MSRQKIAETLAANVKALRSSRGLSLDRLAELAGCTKSHVWEIEQGRSANPTIHLATSLAAALGVSLNYLIGISADKPDLHHEAMRIACEIDALLRAPSTGGTND